LLDSLLQEVKMFLFKKLKHPATTAPLIFSISLLQTQEDSHDIVDLRKQNEEITEMYRDRSQLTWSQRLSLMWRRDEYGNLSPELNQVFECTLASTFAGGVVGSYIDSQRDLKIFLERNKHEMFKHPRIAQAALREKLMLSYMRGFARLGTRTGSMAFVYVSVAQSLATLRNYVNPLDHAIGGATMGIVYKMNMGLKGMAAGGIVGGLLGLQGGCAWWLMHYVSGETVEQKWRREFQYLENKNKQKEEEIEAKDFRKDIISDEKDKANYDEEDKPEDYDFVLKYVLKARNWLQSVGLMKPDVQFGSFGDNSQESEVTSDESKNTQEQTKSDQS